MPVGPFGSLFLIIDCLLGGFEARGCDTVTTALVFIHKMVTDCPAGGYCYHDYYFLPMANPDGHEYHR